MALFRISVFLPMVAGLLLIGPADVRSEELCGEDREPKDFVGGYTVTIGSALLSGGQRKIGIKATETFPATMSLIDGELVLEAGPNSIPFRIAGNEEPDWLFDPVGDLKIDSADFEILMGCSITDLPRLIGQGTSRSMEGNPIEFTYRLIAYTVSEDGSVRDLFGSLKWSGGGVGVSRVVMMSRQ